MELLLDILGLAAGIAVLVWSADVFVDGSAAFARRCGMSPLLIGMIIIGFGTSMPEMLVSALAAAEHSPSIALGNAYGSNIANIGLILGLTALLAPITVSRSVVWREIPTLIFATVIGALFLLNGGVITRGEAFLMLGVFFVVMAVNGMVSGKKQEASEVNARPMTLGKSILMIVGGLLLLVGSSRLLVVCAIRIARVLGVPDLIIGLTIVAIGTSLPELASSIAAIRKKEHDLVIGNIIGSNLFNTLAVVGIACAISPMTEGVQKDAVAQIIHRDIWVVGAMTLLLWGVCIPWRRGRPAVINRCEGLVLALFFVGYLGWLVYCAI
jgi:cation:H+ antiporter